MTNSQKIRSLRLRDALHCELSSNCQRRPTKRKALELAHILMEERVNAYSLMRARELLFELLPRIDNAKV